MLPRPLTNFEIQKYYQNEPKLNGAYSKNNLPKTRKGIYIINLDKYELIRTHWIVLHAKDDNARHFDIIINIYGIQEYSSVICRYFCIEFIDFTMKEKSLLDSSNLFSLSEYEKGNKK